MDIRVSVLLKPIWFNRKPTGRISIGTTVREFVLEQATWFDLDVTGSLGDTITLTIEQYGKTVRDTVVATGQDTAIVIDQIKLNGLTNPEFIWHGVYRPDYPPHYPAAEAVLYKHTYLGWNGVWTLDMNLPIYTWIHKTLNLGWIYD